ncbi:GtrA family protein [Paenibacillus vini]|uniref:GtrA family protein n=1 Tax=Paenibacillus vini TaxID=1476024 RepID=UPI00338F31B2
MINLGQYRESIQQFIKYGLVGISNVAVSLACFYLVMSVFDLHYLLANIFAFLCGLLNSYLLNKYWVFRPGKTNKSSSFKFILVNVVNFGINSLLLVLLVEQLRFSPITAQPFIIFITTVFGFFMTKIWVFKNKKKQVGR